jgi:hypothetical protein
VLKLSTIVVFLYSSISFADFIPQNLKTLDFDNLEFTLSKNNIKNPKQGIKKTPAKKTSKENITIQYIPVYIPIRVPVYQPIYIPKYIPINY